MYIERHADGELLEHCRAGEYVYVLSTRQVGKSSLMYRTARQLRASGFAAVIVDLSCPGAETTAEQWYLGLLTRIAQRLLLDFDVLAWWQTNAQFGETERFARFFTELKEHTDPVYSAQFSPDGQRIVTASDDRTARVWEATTGKPIAELKGHSAAVSSAQFSPDGQWIVTASGDKTAIVYPYEMFAPFDDLRRLTKSFCVPAAGRYVNSDLRNAHG